MVICDVSLYCFLGMHSGKETKTCHTRNNTPTYIRFKRTPLPHQGKSTSKPDTNEHPNSERSNSRASKASMEHYDKRILNLSKLSNIGDTQKKS